MVKQPFNNISAGGHERSSEFLKAIREVVRKVKFLHARCLLFRVINVSYKPTYIPVFRICQAAYRGLSYLSESAEFPCHDPRFWALIAVATCSQKVDVYHAKNRRVEKPGDKNIAVLKTNELQFFMNFRGPQVLRGRL